MTKSNKEKIEEYLEALQIEINPSENYVKINMKMLFRLSNFFEGINFKDMTRENILSYLNSLRKSEDEDPLHKWIGTYNLYLTNLARFFKWLYKPALEPRQRPRPELLNNIPKLKRKEVSIYKPTDLWTLEDDLVFLKWCPSVRDRCYHAISRDLSARPHEILNLKIKDIVFKQSGSKRYAEVLVNGKTGTRHLPLIDSLPYVKEWLDHHPQRNNKNAYLICTMFRGNVGGRLTRTSLLNIYTIQYKETYFPRLLKDPTVSKGDKHMIEELLKKPWNLYIRRHSSLTQKSRYLHGSIFNQHAGWSPGSKMNLKYEHYFGNESSESILQEYGILPKDNQETHLLRPKSCPNCDEPYRPDSKFCAKCRMVLTYDAYSETLHEQQVKDKQIEEMIRKQEQFEQLIQSLIDSRQLKPTS